MKWYKRDPSAALAGMIGLTVEERGAYNAVIDLAYARAPHGDVTDALVIAALAIRPQMWRRLKARLIALGKIRELDGKLLANRVETEVQTAAILMANPVSSGRVSRATSANFNELGYRPRSKKMSYNHNHNQILSSYSASHNSKKQKASEENRPAGSLATALPSGALARQPTGELANGAKPPSATSRAELDALLAGRRARANGAAK